MADVLSAIQDKDSRVGFVVGEATEDNHSNLPFFDCGRVVALTDSGKTLTTESGVVFKRQWSKNRYSVIRNPNTTMVVIQGSPKR